MSNPASPLDPRTHAFRPDLADAALRATVTAARYVEPSIRQCVQGVIPLLATPDPDARQVSQIRYGEFLDVFEIRMDGFAWVQNRIDRYVGYLPSAGTLRDAIADLSWRLGALRSFVYPEPDLKSPPIDELTLGSYIQPGEKRGNFTALPGGGFVFTAHIVGAEAALTPDYAFTAGRLLNTPYLWGGRTPKGIDCSGLVQLALEMAGIESPRDSDQQREAFGQPLSRHWRDTPWKRGDLVFMKDDRGAPHVGIMTNSDHMIHATASVMSVVVEPLFDVVLRGVEILAAGRP
ncbi:MAG: NlpC/P60 family protein [Alphaproteobacteria bacterium]|nr:NlpC/P60 family protein [Alphaproteobacteria bacterium]